MNEPRFHAQLADRIATYLEGALAADTLPHLAARFPVGSTNHGPLEAEIRLVPERTQLVVFEHTPAGLVARCLLCGDEADPVTNPPWHGQHIRGRHPKYVTWEATVIPEFDEKRPS